MTEFWPGQQRFTTPSSDYNADRFHMQQVLNRVNTAAIVKVTKVSNNGGVTAVGTVNVQPLVNMQDGNGKQYKHATAFKLPYFRLQGGKNGIILDPKVDDIGLAVFADRDISSVKKTKKQGPAGSRRRFSMADGLFICLFLSDSAPENYVRFKDDGTIIVHHKSNFEGVFADDVAQIKKKGSSDLHVSVTSSDIILGKTPIIGPDPHPGD